jgi:Mycothiol maleylpyruvate isomerase N-terminal domain
LSDTDELSLLAEATRYLFGSMLLVRDGDLSAPTPCQGWDLRRLLRHLRGSLADVTDLLVAAVRDGVVDFLLAATSVPTAGRRCEIAGRSLPAKIVVYVGALEMVLHAWDIAQACRAGRAIPSDLASALLRVSPPLAEAGLAGNVLAEPLPAPTTATPGDRLLALFGRRPTGPDSCGP